MLDLVESGNARKSTGATEKFVFGHVVGDRTASPNKYRCCVFDRLAVATRPQIYQHHTKCIYFGSWSMADSIIFVESHCVLPCFSRVQGLSRAWDPLCTPWSLIDWRIILRIELVVACGAYGRPRLSSGSSGASMASTQFWRRRRGQMQEGARYRPWALPVRIVHGRCPPALTMGGAHAHSYSLTAEGP